MGHPVEDEADVTSAMRRLTATFACALLTLACREEAALEAAPPVAAVQSELKSALEHSASAQVIVNFRQPAGFRRQDRAARRLAIERSSDSILGRAGAGLSVSHRYRHVPALAGRVSREALARLARDPDVATIELDTPGRPLLREAIPASGADQVKALLGLTGKGVRVATIDTGVQLDHPDLKDALVAQHCFASDCSLWSDGETAEDVLGHGTAVAGIIASRGEVSPAGFAPEAELIPVKVLSSGTGLGFISDWIAGLEWIDENLDTLHVDIVNISLGSEPLYESFEDCDRAQSALAGAVENLIEKGVIVVAGVGNAGSTTGVAAPACNRGVIAVGAAYDAELGMQPSDAPNYSSLSSSFAACSDPQTEAGQVVCITNAGPRLDVVIPSFPMLTSYLESGAMTFRGSSAAAAAVSGVAALARQCNPQLSPAKLREALVDTGLPRLDPASGRAIPVVRALELIRSVCPDLRDPTPVPDAGVMPTAAPDSGTDAGAGALPRKRSGERSARLLGERYRGGAPAPPLASQPGAELDAGRVTRSREPESADRDESRDEEESAELAQVASEGHGDSYSCRAAGESCDSPWLPGLILASLGLIRRRRPPKLNRTRAGGSESRADDVGGQRRSTVPPSLQ
jgi:Subtilase family